VSFPLKVLGGFVAYESARWIKFCRADLFFYAHTALNNGAQKKQCVIFVLFRTPLEEE